MNDYTPTTEQVRQNWAFTRSGDRIHRTDEHFAEFDRWLARHDAEVKAEGWDRGYIAGGSHARRQWSDEPDLPDHANPYRAIRADS